MEIGRNRRLLRIVKNARGQDSRLLMTQCQPNLARNLYLVPQNAALTIVPKGLDDDVLRNAEAEGVPSMESSRKGRQGCPRRRYRPYMISLSSRGREQSVDWGSPQNGGEGPPQTPPLGARGASHPIMGEDPTKPPLSLRPHCGTPYNGGAPNPQNTFPSRMAIFVTSVPSLRSGTDNGKKH